MTTHTSWTRWAAAIGALIAAWTMAAPSTGAEREPRGLSTTHVTLYDCGLAQLERQTRVRGAERLAIPVELAHLDDLLASLVLATDGDVQVREVRYPSVQNLGQAVAASGLGNALHDGGDGLATPGDLAGYVRALRGTPIAVVDGRGRRREGTVMGCVERAPVAKPAPEGDEPARAEPAWAVVLAGDGGALIGVFIRRAAGGIGVGHVLRNDPHARGLSAQARRGDLERF